jgi:hypothetical protein
MTQSDLILIEKDEEISLLKSAVRELAQDLIICRGIKDDYRFCLEIAQEKIKKLETELAILRRITAN